MSSTVVDSHLVAYAAGLFEGEGCVNISRSKTRAGRWQWLLNITVKMCDREPIAMIAAHWGGAVHEHPHTEGRKDVYSWRATARRAAAFLAEIEPYLVSTRRKKTARLGIAFQSQKRNHGRVYPPVYLEAQQRFYCEMRALNMPRHRRAA